jgi:hypothetical protein
MGIAFVGAGNTGIVAGGSGSTYNFCPLNGYGSPGLWTQGTSQFAQIYTAWSGINVWGLTAAQGPLNPSFTLSITSLAIGGTQTISDTAPTDTTHTDTGQYAWTLQWSNVTGGGVQRLQMLYQFTNAPGGHGAIYGSAHSGVGAALAAGGTYYLNCLCGQPGAQTIEANAQGQIGTPGALYYGAYPIALTNTTTAPTVFTLRINGANGLATFTVAAGAIGSGRNNGPDPVNVGDLVCLQAAVGAGSGTIYLQAATANFSPTATLTPGQNDVFAQVGQAVATNLFWPIYGYGGGGFGANAAAQVALGYAYSVTRFAIGIIANGGTGTAGLNVTRNGANVPPNGINIAPGATGWFVSQPGGVNNWGPTDTISFFAATFLSGTYTIPNMLTLQLHATRALTPNQASDTGAAADTSSGYVARTDTVPEAGAANDSTDSAALHPTTVSESGAAADTSFATYTSTGDVVAEQAAANDTVKINGVYPSAVIEGAVAHDTAIVFNGIGQFTLEQGNAVDTSNIIALVTRPYVYEAGKALDTPSAGVRRENDIIEQGAAQDFTEGFDLIRLSVVEQGVARDAQIVMGSLAYAQVLGMTARVVHRHPVIGGILDDETIPLLDDQGVPVFEDS